ncbi:MAG: hypothetical protein ACRDRG_17400 [Pseudonocardiaceae bacterium]
MGLRDVDTALGLLELASNSELVPGYIYPENLDLSRPAWAATS